MRIVCPTRKKYNAFCIAIIAILFLGIIPLLGKEDLEGATLVHFISLLAFTCLGIIAMLCLMPLVRRKEIQFFKEFYSLENFEVFTLFELPANLYIFDIPNEEIEFTAYGIKNLSSDVLLPYDSFKISAETRCWASGEMYKIYVNFVTINQSFSNEEDNLEFSIKLDPTLYNVIRKYEIKVENLDDAFNNCQTNLKNFFQSKKTNK